MNQYRLKNQNAYASAIRMLYMCPYYDSKSIFMIQNKHIGFQIKPNQTKPNHAYAIS